MPLKDHFHEPLDPFCQWHSFHQNWAVKMSDRLNEVHLSDSFRALTEGELGVPIGMDVATFERDESGSLFEGRNGHEGGSVAVAPEVYAPPAPAITCEADFTDPDLLELKVYHAGSGWNLVAAVELVSESDKDREDARDTFAVKCASYLKHGVSVVVVDAVANRSGNLHNAICDRLGAPDSAFWTSRTGLSVVAYRGVRVKDKDRLDAWPYAIGLGEPLPTVPLWLSADLAVPLELELTYANACRGLKLA
jgi:hypothetical protein